jgi:hypothetical protein
MRSVMAKLVGDSRVVALTVCVALAGYAAGSMTKADATMENAGAVVLARSAPVSLGNKAVRIALPGGRGLAAKLAQRSSGQHVQLVMLHLSAHEQPGISYKVYLGLSDGAAPDEWHFVEAINFYNAVGLDGHPPKQPPSAVFDVTALASKVAAKGLADAELSVTFVPDGEPAPGSMPVISAIQLMEN